MAKPVDFLFSLAGEPTSTPADQPLPVVFIIGPPRSGTTLTYQVMARYCDVTYPDNLNTLFPRSPLRSMAWLSRRDPPRKALIRSCYGQTARFSGPNEGFHIWDRWFGKNRYNPVTDLPPEQLSEINQFLSTWTSLKGKPFLNKNNRSTACLEPLTNSIPSSYFVLIQRDHSDIIRSLIRGREFVQGSRQHPWGLFSQHTEAPDDPLSYVDDVCAQVEKISQFLKTQTATVPSNRLIPIDYKALCEDPAATLREISDAVPGLNLRQDLIASELRRFRVSTNNYLSDEEEARMKRWCQSAE